MTTLGLWVKLSLGPRILIGVWIHYCKLLWIIASAEWRMLCYVMLCYIHCTAMTFQTPLEYRKQHAFLQSCSGRWSVRPTLEPTLPHVIAAHYQIESWPYQCWVVGGVIRQSSPLPYLTLVTPLVAQHCWRTVERIKGCMRCHQFTEDDVAMGLDCICDWAFQTGKKGVIKTVHKNVSRISALLLHWI